jgi:hypothetical protein
MLNMLTIFNILNILYSQGEMSFINQAHERLSDDLKNLWEYCHSSDCNIYNFYLNTCCRELEKSK